MGNNALMPISKAGHVTESLVPRSLLPAAGILITVLVLFAGPAVALLLALLILVAVLLLERPMIFVAGCAVVICTNAADVATDFYQFSPMVGLLVPVLAVTLLARVAIGREDLTGVYKVLLPVLIYLLGRSISLLYVSDTDVTLERSVKLAKDMMIVLVFAGFLTTMARVRIVTAAAGFSIAAIALLSDIQYLTGTFQWHYFGFANAVVRQIVVGSSDSWRLIGTLTDANFFGQLLVMGMPLVLVFAVRRGHPALRGLSVLAAIAILLAIVFTFSRGALVAVGVVGLIALLATRGSRIALIGMAGLVAASLLVMPQSVYDRLTPLVQAGAAAITGGQYIADPALGQRRSVAAAALDMAASNPWLGIGLGQFHAQYGNYALMGGYDIGAPHEAHNLYLEALSEGGIVGLTLLLAMVVGSLVLANRARHALAAVGEGGDAIVVGGIALSTIGFLATSLFLHGAYQRFLWFDIGLLLAVWARAQYYPSSGRQSPIMWKEAMRTDHDLLSDVLGLLGKRAWLILAFGGIGLLGGIYQANRAPPEFKAEQTLLYRFGRDYFPIAPGEARRDWGANVMISLDNALFTEMRLLASRELLEKTVSKVLPGDLQAGDARLSPSQTLAQSVDRVSRKFAVERVQGAAMVSVSASATDPVVADSIVNEQIAGYLAQRQALFGRSSANFYDTQIKASLDRLAKLTATRAAIVKANEPSGSKVEPGSIGDMVQLQRVDAGISATRSELELLMKERSAAVVSEQYWDEVVPVVKVIDRQQAAGNPVGLPPVARMAMLTFLGLVIGLVVAFLVTYLGSARGESRNRMPLPAGE